MRPSTERLGLLALVAPALFAVSGCIAPTDAPSPAAREDAPSPVAPLLFRVPPGTIALAPTFYRALNQSTVDMGPAAGRFCTLNGIWGAYGIGLSSEIASYAQVLVVNGRFQLQTGFASSASAVCVAWNDFSGANATSPASNAEMPYAANVWDNLDHSVGLYPVAGSACLLSGVSGQWTGTNRTNSVAVTALANDFGLVAATDGPTVGAQATCFQFLDRAPLATTIYSLPQPGVDGFHVELPNAKTALCGIQALGGHLLGQLDGISILVDSDFSQTAFLTGNLQSATVACVSLAQN